MSSPTDNTPRSYREEATEVLSFTQCRRSPLREIPDLVEPVFVGAALGEVRKEYAYPKHQHAEYEVVCVDKGRYRCRHNDRFLELAKNDVFIVKPGDWHQDSCARGLRYFTLRFHLANHLHPDREAALFRDGVGIDDQVLRGGGKTLLPVIRRIHAESRVDDAVSPHIEDMLVGEFFWRLVRALPRRVISEELVRTSRDVKFVTDLFGVFQEHLTVHLTVRDMARSMGMSESALAHACKKILNSGPARLFALRKMEYALELVQQTRMSIKEISHFLGFQNQYHFSRAFRRAHGKSPSEHR